MATEKPVEYQKVQRKTETRQRSQRNVQQSAPEQFRPQAAPVNMNMGVSQYQSNTGLDVLNGLNEALKGGTKIINQAMPMILEEKERQQQIGREQVELGMLDEMDAIEGETDPKERNKKLQGGYWIREGRNEARGEAEMNEEG